MNVENILKVADAIESHSIPDLGFNMSDFFGEYVDQTGHNCGTTACIAGWAHAIAHGEYDTDTLVYPHLVADWLGLDEKRSNALFYAEGHPDDARPRGGTWFGDIQPAHAVAVLRHLAATGEVDWGLALQAEPA